MNAYEEDDTFSILDAEEGLGPGEREVYEDSFEKEDEEEAVSDEEEEYEEGEYEEEHAELEYDDGGYASGEDLPDQYSADSESPSEEDEDEDPEQVGGGPYRLRSAIKCTPKAHPSSVASATARTYLASDQESDGPPQSQPQSQESYVADDMDLDEFSKYLEGLDPAIVASIALDAPITLSPANPVAPDLPEDDNPFVTPQASERDTRPLTPKFPKIDHTNGNDDTFPTTPSRVPAFATELHTPIPRRPGDTPRASQLLNGNVDGAQTPNESRFLATSTTHREQTAPSDSPLKSGRTSAPPLFTPMGADKAPRTGRTSAPPVLDATPHRPARLLAADDEFGAGNNDPQDDEELEESLPVKSLAPRTWLGRPKREEREATETAFAQCLRILTDLSRSTGRPLSRFIDRFQLRNGGGSKRTLWNIYESYFAANKTEEMARAGATKEDPSICYSIFQRELGDDWMEFLLCWDEVRSDGTNVTVRQRFKDYTKLVKKIESIAQEAENRKFHVVSIIVGGNVNTDGSMGTIVATEPLQDFFPKYLRRRDDVVIGMMRTACYKLTADQTLENLSEDDDLDEGGSPSKHTPRDTKEPVTNGLNKTTFPEFDTANTTIEYKRRFCREWLKAALENAGIPCGKNLPWANLIKVLVDYARKLLNWPADVPFPHEINKGNNGVKVLTAQETKAFLAAIQSTTERPYIEVVSAQDLQDKLTPVVVCAAPPHTSSHAHGRRVFHDLTIDEKGPARRPPPPPPTPKRKGKQVAQPTPNSDEGSQPPRKLRPRTRPALKFRHEDDVEDSTFEPTSDTNDGSPLKRRTLGSVATDSDEDEDLPLATPCDDGDDLALATHSNNAPPSVPPADTIANPKTSTERVGSKKVTFVVKRKREVEDVVTGMEEPQPPVDPKKEHKPLQTRPKKRRKRTVVESEASLSGADIQELVDRRVTERTMADANVAKPKRLPKPRPKAKKNSPDDHPPESASAGITTHSQATTTVEDPPHPNDPKPPSPCSQPSKGASSSLTHREEAVIQDPPSRDSAKGAPGPTKPQPANVATSKTLQKRPVPPHPRPPRVSSTLGTGPPPTITDKARPDASRHPSKTSATGPSKLKPLKSSIPTNHKAKTSVNSNAASAAPSIQGPPPPEKHRVRERATTMRPISQLAIPDRPPNPPTATTPTANDEPQSSVHADPGAVIQMPDGRRIPVALMKRWLAAGALSVPPPLAREPTTPSKRPLETTTREGVQEKRPKHLPHGNPTSDIVPSDRPTSAATTSKQTQGVTLPGPSGSSHPQQTRKASGKHADRRPQAAAPAAGPPRPPQRHPFRQPPQAKKEPHA